MCRLFTRMGYVFSQNWESVQIGLIISSSLLKQNLVRIKMNKVFL